MRNEYTKCTGKCLLSCHSQEWWEHLVFEMPQQCCNAEIESCVIYITEATQWTWNPEIGWFLSLHVLDQPVEEYNNESGGNLVHSLCLKKKMESD